MPKRNRKQKKVHLTEADKCLVKLEEISRTARKDAAIARSLIDWYLENHSWTQKQYLYAKAIINKRPESQRSSVERKYYLYAMADKYSVKLGVSTDVKRRLKSIQTGHPERLKVVWEFYTGKDRKHAMAQEKKLHRYCKKYKKRGEWFSVECMTLVEQFKVKEVAKRVQEEERAEMEIVTNAIIHI